MSPALREARLMLSAVQFLTRLPVPDPGWEDGRLRRASRYFGLVGLLVGTLMGLTWMLALQIWPAPVAAGLALLAGLLITGALHEDGLADCADALGARGGRERALEIMRDSRIGTYGALALVMVMGLRWGALSALPAERGAIALALGATVGRALLVPVTAIAPYARGQGLGSAMGRGAGPAEILMSMGVAMVVAVLAGAWGGAALALAAVAGLAVLRGLVRWLGGYTGDGLGAIAALGETVVLLVLAAAWARP